MTVTIEEGDGTMQQRLDMGLCPKCQTALNPGPVTLCRCCGLEMSMNKTHLMPEASPTESMEWSSAAMVIEVCVDEMLDKIAKNPDDYLPDADIEIIEAWQRILRG